MTLGADFSEKKIILNNKNIHFQIWDIAGQDNFKNVRARFLNNVNGVFMVCIAFVSNRYVMTFEYKIKII